MAKVTLGSTINIQGTKKISRTNLAQLREPTVITWMIVAGLPTHTCDGHVCAAAGLTQCTPCTMEAKGDPVIKLHPCSRKSYKEWRTANGHVDVAIAKKASSKSKRNQRSDAHDAMADSGSDVDECDVVTDSDDDVESNKEHDGDSEDGDSSSDDDIPLDNFNLTKQHDYTVHDRVEVWYDKFDSWFEGVVDKVGVQIIEVYFKKEDVFDTLHVKMHKIRPCK